MTASSSACENAAKALDRFSAGLKARDIADLPERIATAFNSVRFGQNTLSPDEARLLRRDLQTFSELVTSRQQQSKMA